MARTSKIRWLIGYYLYRQGQPAEAAQWFRFALDSGLGSDAAEGYIIALRATGDREDAFLAREVAYQWREQTPELMESYLDAAATILTADELGGTAIDDVEQTTVDRFVPVVIQQRDANGAQSLGWYAFNTCQFIIAEEWFISSANWVPTEAAIYGLALTRMRLGDRKGFEEVVKEWGPLYRSVRGLVTGEDLDPEDPVTGGSDDPTDEVGVDAVVCDPKERERLRSLIVEQQRRQAGRLAADPVTFTEAGSLNAAPFRVQALASRPAGTTRPDIPRRSVVIRPEQPIEDSLLIQVQATVPLPTPPQPTPPQPTPVQSTPPQPTLPQPTPMPTAPQPVRGATGESESVIRQRALGAEPRFRDTRSETTIRRRGQRLRGGQDAGTTTAELPEGSTVARRVRQDAASDTDVAVREIVARRSTSSRSSAGRGGSAGGSSAQQALSSGNYRGCVEITDRGLVGGNLSAEDASTRGFCLLQLDRSFEAAQAFQLARLRARYGTSISADVVYGSTLAALAADQTKEAAVAATQGPMTRPRRTEVQISILTQRAIAANRDGRYVEALYFLDQRNRIAPLQKDLMLLQGFAYRNAGYYREADRIFRAVDKAGPTAESRRALGDSSQRFLGDLRPNLAERNGNSFR